MRNGREREKKTEKERKVKKRRRERDNKNSENVQTIDNCTVYCCFCCCCCFLWFFQYFSSSRRSHHCCCFQSILFCSLEFSFCCSTVVRYISFVSTIFTCGTHSIQNKIYIVTHRQTSQFLTYCSLLLGYTFEAVEAEWISSIVRDRDRAYPLRRIK